jgi:hypothetical protein
VVVDEEFEDFAGGGPTLEIPIKFMHFLALIIT